MEIFEIVLIILMFILFVLIVAILVFMGLIFLSKKEKKFFPYASEKEKAKRKRTGVVDLGTASVFSGGGFEEYVGEIGGETVRVRRPSYLTKGLFSKRLVKLKPKEASDVLVLKSTDEDSIFDELIIVFPDDFPKWLRDKIPDYYDREEDKRKIAMLRREIRDLRDQLAVLRGREEAIMKEKQRLEALLEKRKELAFPEPQKIVFEKRGGEE